MPHAAFGHAALGLASAMLATGAAAQEAGPSGNSADLPTIEVQGEQGEPANTLQAGTGLSRLPGTIQSTPQVVNVVPQQIIQQQNITTLEQALRNVPGVTVASGEGQGGFNGDQFRIRGFQAKGDIYLDGLRDFGVYTRDSFATEQVQVFKGPSSETFGMGTTGGAINTVSKTAKLGTWYNMEGMLGTGPLLRGTFDINKQINDTTAVRILGMGHKQDVADRDHVFSDRWGFAASVGVGLGTSTSLTLNYMHQTTDRMPDYGVSMVVPPGSRVGRPVTEFGVPRSTYYGKVTDRDVSNVDMFTARFKSEPLSWLTITSDTRLARYDRDFAASPTSSCETTCAASFFAGGNPTVTFTGGNPAFLQNSWGAQNITTAVAKFSTGPFRHELVTGFDMFYQDDERTLVSTFGNKGTQQIRTPIFRDTTGYWLAQNITAANGRREGTARDLAVFVSDRMWFTDQLSVLAGVRYDDYKARYRASQAGGAPGAWVEADTQFASPKVSLIWEPTKAQTFYVSYAKSFSPQGQFITNDLNPINGAQPNLEPEKNDIYEVGGKMSFLDGKLGLTGAVFRVEKSNAFYTDPVTGDATVTGEDQRVQGFELGATGKLTDAWTINAAFARMDSRIMSAPAATAANIGNKVQQVPEIAASVWTTYDIARHIVGLPGQLLVGGGVFYTSGYYTNSANTYYVPDTFSLDAMISYEVKNYRVALNAYNLTDELNYGSSFNVRAVPTSGRTFMLSGGIKF